METKKQLGQALVEFAIAAMLIFMLLSAVIDIGIILFTQQGLHNAAQEGAAYGRKMVFNDENDIDKDGITEGDIFCNSGAGSKCEENGEEFDQPFSGYLDEIRIRTSFEAGSSGGIVFSNLRDLDGSKDGPDSLDTLRNLIEVYITNDQSCKNYDGGCACDATIADQRNGEGCYVRVNLRSRYDILFPLAPAFGDEVWIRSSYVMKLNTSGFSQLGEVETTPIIATLEATATPTETPVPSVTPTPVPLDVCNDAGVLSDVQSPWWQIQVSPTDAMYPTLGQSNTSGDEAGYVANLCSSGEGVNNAEDNMTFVYVPRTEGEAINLEFEGRLSQFLGPDAAVSAYKDGTAEAGLMMRKFEPGTGSPFTGAPFVMISFDKDTSRVVFKTRTSYSGDITEVAAADVSVDPADPNLSFRIQRTSSLVSVWYKEEAGLWTMLGDWTDIQSWFEIDENTQAYFGLVLTPGHDSMPNDPSETDYPKKFATAQFDNVVFRPLDDVVNVDYIVPAVNGLSLNSSDDLRKFEVDLSPDDFETASIVLTEFTVIGPDKGAVPDLEASDTAYMPCQFGGVAGDCFMPDDAIYDALPRGSYQTTVRVETGTGLQDSDTRWFIIDPIFLNFVLPNEGQEIAQQDNTAWSVDVYDPKYATKWDEASDEHYDNKAIDKVVFELVIDTDVVSWEQPGTARNSAGMLCVYGVTNGTCNTMSDTDYANLISGGQYIIRATAHSVDGTTINWLDADMEFRAKRTFKVPELVVSYLLPTSEISVENVDETRFEVEAYAPHRLATPGVPENGLGVEGVQYRLLTESRDVLYQSPDGAAETNAIENDKFCFFGVSGSDCNTMPSGSGIPDGELNYNTLDGGTYILQARALRAGGDPARSRDWSDWAEQSFTIPRQPIAINFVDEDGDELPSNDLGLMTDIDTTNFRVKAYKEGGSDADGEGIQEVQFQLIDPDGDAITLDAGVGASATDDTPVYCIFGETSGVCNPMSDDNLYSTLKAGTYTVKARAKAGSVGDPDRLSSAAVLTFEIPEVRLVFADPNEEYEDDGALYTDDKKEIDRQDYTRFEIYAFDPRYAGSDYDPDEVDVEELYNGTGITQVRYTVYDEDDDPVSVGDLDNIQFTFDEDTDDLLCAFGEEDSNTCNQMDLADFSALPAGDYRIRAWVQNAALEDAGEWSEWVEAEFLIPDIHVSFWRKNTAFANSREEITADNEIDNLSPQNVWVLVRDDARFWIEVYDPRFPDDGSSSRGINSVSFDYVGTGTTSLLDTATHLGNTSQEYCTYDGTTSPFNCGRMTTGELQWLESGTYEVRAHIEADSGTYDVVVGYFTMQAPELEVAWSHPDYGELDGTETITFTDFSDTDFELLAKASGETVNGTGVSKTYYELYGPDGALVSSTYYRTNDTTKPFCPFKEQGGACKAINDGGALANGQYRLVARVQESAGSKRWSNPLEVLFTVEVP